MDILYFFFNLIMTIGSLVSIWVVVKGPESVQDAFKKLIDKISNLQLISKLKIQERMEGFSLSISKILTSINNNKKMIAFYFYGIISGVSIAALIILIAYIRITGWEKIVVSLKMISSEKIEPQPSLYGGINIDIIRLLWFLVFLFGIIGAIRGWAKELLVIFSVITALAVNLLLEKFIPVVRDLDKTTLSMFWIRMLILISLIYFGYQMSIIPSLSPKATRERLQDTLFGSVFGSINGYLIVGSILYYFDFARYPYPRIIAPATDPVFLQKIEKMMLILPPQSLGEPSIYFVLILLLIFVLIVYV